MPVPKEEWGTKRLCPTTGKRFFDLNKSPIVSPYTGEVVIFESGGKSRITVVAKPEKPAKAEPKLTEEAEEVLEDADESDAKIDDDLLDDDEDDTLPLDEIADVASETDES